MQAKNKSKTLEQSLLKTSAAGHEISPNVLPLTF